MPRIVQMAAFIPEDIEFVLPDGSKVVAPGDPPVELILRMIDRFERGQNDSEEEAGLAVMRELDQLVLELLQMRDPELQRSPFGIAGLNHFVLELLAAYNFMATGLEESPTTPGATEPPEDTTSASSPGSRARSKGSGSRRTTTRG